MYSENPRDIADPWYTGDFETTYNDIVEGCIGFLKYLEKYARETSILTYDDEGFDEFLKEISAFDDSNDSEEFINESSTFNGSEAFDKYYEYSKFPKFEDIEL